MESISYERQFSNHPQPMRFCPRTTNAVACVLKRKKNKGGAQYFMGYRWPAIFKRDTKNFFQIKILQNGLCWSFNLVGFPSLSQVCVCVPVPSKMNETKKCVIQFFFFFTAICPPPSLKEVVVIATFTLFFFPSVQLFVSVPPSFVFLNFRSRLCDYSRCCCCCFIFSFFPPHSTTRFFPGGTWRDTRSRRHTHTQNQLRKKKIPTAPIIDFRSATSTSRAPLCKKKTTTTTTHFLF